MVSNAISIPDEKKFVIDIYEKLSSTDDDESNNPLRLGVRICHVPNTLRLAKPEDFVPHFVGLGPYHHSDELIVSDKMKLGAGKRVLKILFPNNNGHILNHLLQNLESYTLIPYFYKLDTTSTADDYPTFLYQLIIDAIFLLALLHHSNNHSTQEWNDYYILTGANRNMPLLDTAGEELSMDGFIRDIFMLENQIPTHVLKLVSQVNMNNKIDYFAATKQFCKVYSPLNNTEHVDRELEEEYHHLLDMMYHMVAPVPQPDHKPPPMLLVGDILIRTFIYPLLLIWALLWAFVYLVVVTLHPILWLTRSILLGVVPWFVSIFEPQKVMTLNPIYFLKSVIDLFQASIIRPLPSSSELIIVINNIINDVELMTIPGRLLEKEPTYSWDEGTVMIPSATELHNVGMRFKQILYFGISHIILEEERFVLHLPQIKLGVLSEVIIANLVAYESLTKSNCLIFTKYIELMRALVGTVEDVKLLRNANIIETQLRDNEVVQIFQGMPMNKPIRRPINTRLQKLETGIKKVKARLDGIGNLKLFANDFIRALVIFLTIGVFYPTLVQAFKQVLCSSVFAPSLGLCQPHFLTVI